LIFLKAKIDSAYKQYGEFQLPEVNDKVGMDSPLVTIFIFCEAKIDSTHKKYGEL
jgi:hypothetical protein